MGLYDFSYQLLPMNESAIKYAIVLLKCAIVLKMDNSNCAVVKLKIIAEILLFGRL